jgi:hypothetical protein
MNNTVVPALAALLVIALASILLVFLSDQAIVTDKAFAVVSDTSEYSCVISEVDKDLSLDCLKVSD